MYILWKSPAHPKHATWQLRARAARQQVLEDAAYAALREKHLHLLEPSSEVHARGGIVKAEAKRTWDLGQNDHIMNE